MKQFLTVLLITISLSASAQKTDSVFNAAIETVYQKFLTIPVKLTNQEWEVLKQNMVAILREAISEWNKNKKQ